MKAKNQFIAVILALLGTTACDDSLDLRPLSELTPDVFFNTAQDLELYTNGFYPMLPSTSIYSRDGSSDNIIEMSLDERVRGDRVVPTSGGGWGWGELRDINYFLAHYQTSNDVSAKKKYSGVARFFRAYFYFNKVKRFGDVPWYSKPIDIDDEEALYKGRDPRGDVIDSVLVDLDYAVNNLPSSIQVYAVTKWTALALKSRVALFEGTFRKYHGMGEAEKYLKAAAESAKQLMDSGRYQLYSMGTPYADYSNLFSSHDAIASEVILAAQYSGPLNIKHSANYYTLTPSYGRPGMPKDMVNSYLNKDGSRFTDQPNYNKIMFYEEVQNRDPRLSQTIRTPGYHRIGETKILSPDLSATVTGYQLTKFVTEPSYDTYNKSINDIPLIRYAEILLNYAEAKAELGTLTQTDLDQSINQLRARVDMPSLILDQANANPDPFLEAQYPHVDQGGNEGVILEIRRERRIELYMEGFRWYDLMRWKEGQKLTQPFRGMYLPGTGSYNLDHHGSTDLVIYEGEIDGKEDGVVYLELGEDIVLGDQGLIVPHLLSNRAFDENKDYLYPIPRDQLLLNPNLEQNPGWE